MRTWLAGKSKDGFSLMEVCVAIAILGFGSFGVAYMAKTFNRICMLERRQAHTFIDAVGRIERWVEQPPSCDSVEVLNEYVPLGWAEVEIKLNPPARSVLLKRLVQCRK